MRKNGESRGNFCSAAQEILEFFVLILVVSLEKFEYIEFESLTESLHLLKFFAFGWHLLFTVPSVGLSSIPSF